MNSVHKEIQSTPTQKLNADNYDCYDDILSKDEKLLSEDDDDDFVTESLKIESDNNDSSDTEHSKHNISPLRYEQYHDEEIDKKDDNTVVWKGMHECCNTFPSTSHGKCDLDCPKKFPRKVKKQQENFPMVVSKESEDKKMSTKCEKKNFKTDIDTIDTDKKYRIYHHILRHFREDRSYKCKVCPKSFNHLSNLRIHEMYHIGERKFLCDSCPKTYITLTDLKKHQKSHEEDPTFVCNECGRGFMHRYRLVVHMRIHSGTKPFKCLLCNRCFRHKCSLKTHSFTHMGIKPFSCDICKKSFTRKIRLNNHVCTTDNEFPCKVCGKVFKESRYQKQHENACRKKVSSK